MLVLRWVAGGLNQDFLDQTSKSKENYGFMIRVWWKPHCFPLVLGQLSFTLSEGRGVTGIIEALSLAWRALRAARSTLQAEVRHGFLGGWNPPPPLPCGFFMTLQCFLFLGKVVPSHYKHQPTIWRDVSPIKRKWMFHCHDKWDLECHQPYPRNKALTAGLSKRDLVVNNPLLGCA